MSNEMFKNYILAAGKIVPDVMAIITSTVVFALLIFGGKLFSETYEISLGDYIQFFILIFIAGTMVVGIWVQRKNEAFNRSAAYLEKAIELIDKARSVLESTGGSPTSDRISWVSAARLITRAQEIACEISFDAHKKIFDAEHDFQRHTFWNFLSTGGHALPAVFFTGGPLMTTSIGNSVHSEFQKENGALWIPARVVAVIYRFFQYPEGYEDPLDKSKPLSQREIDRLRMFGQPGVCEYLAFRKNFVAVGNQIRQVGQGIDLNQPKSAAEIDQQMALLVDRWVED